MCYSYLLAISQHAAVKLLMLQIGSSQTGKWDIISYNVSYGLGDFDLLRV